MIGYNDDSVYIGQIKQILKDFNLPRCRVYIEELGDSQLLEGAHYIKDDAIYLCSDNKELKRIVSYRYNEKILNITTNFKVSNNIYDSATHKYLGRYLRFIRDFKGVDLMPLYNCCDKTTASKLKLSVTTTIDDEEKELATFDSKDEYHTIYMVPVKFFQNYTIGLDCATDVEMMCCYCVSGANEYLIEKVDFPYMDTYKKVAGTALLKPFLYDNLKSITPTKEMLEQEDNLTLLIKVPNTNTSSIVVVEGDSTSTGEVDVYTNELANNGILEYYPEPQPNENEEVDPVTYVTYPTKLSLFSYWNSTQFNLLSDRLLEYLSLNAITPLSEDYDIAKLQKELIRRGLVDSDYLGIWNNKDRVGLYKFILANQISNNQFDILSYLDKSVEETIGGLV